MSDPLCREAEDINPNLPDDPDLEDETEEALALLDEDDVEVLEEMFIDTHPLS